MKTQIKNLIAEKPKHYVKIIKNNKDMMDWVMSNTKVIDGSIPEMIYSAIFNETNICENGNVKKFDRFSTGFIGCGPSNICKCTKDSISKNVSLTKKSITPEQKTKTNDIRKATMLQKYGVEYNSKREDIHHIWKKPKVSEDNLSKLSDYNWLNTEYNELERTLVDIAQELNVYYGTVSDYCLTHGFKIRQRSQYSLTELEIIKFIESFGIKCEHGNWDIIGKELDIYIPEKKIAIEVNGLYWHSYHPDSEKIENPMRHLEKTNAVEKKGIELIHITDYEWNNKKQIIKSIIKSKLGLNTKIYARKCQIKQVDKKLEKQFINQYHLQGYISSDLAYGLYYNDELISLMSFGKSRYSKLADMELLRFCTKDDVTVIGGGSKLLNQINSSIVSYCNLDKSYGNGYIKIGFKLHHTSPVGYFWTDGTNIISRYKAQKNNMKKWLVNFNPSLTEAQNMFNAGYRRFYDCGNKVFVYEK